jgi:hypothetical protein
LIEEEGRMNCRRFWVNIIGMFPVLFVITIVSWAYFVYVVMLQAPLFVQKPFCTTLELLGFHILFAFFLVSYFRTVITNPGEIPQDFPEEVREYF